MKLVKPPRLTQGDLIGIIAPSLPLFPNGRAELEKSKQLIQQWGFETLEGDTIGLNRWWSAGTPEQQAEDINRMFSNPEVRAIITLAGGFSAMSVLDQLDYPMIAQNPKPFIGMSDITLYQWAMLSKSNLLGFHGNTMTEGFADFYYQLAPEYQEQLKQSYLSLLTRPEPLGVLPVIAARRCLRSGISRGRLIGGCLKRFTALAGTEFDLPKSVYKDAILFWEDIGETIYDLSLYLYKLKHLGVLDQISGMIIGKLTWVNQYFDELDHPTPEEAIMDVLKDYDFPIMMAEDFGHQRSMLPLVIGLETEIDCANLSITLIESAVL